MYRLSLRIDGEITIEAFNEAVANFLRLLHEVERSVVGERMVRWTLEEMRRSSPALLTFLGTPRPKRRKRNEPARPTPDYAPAVGAALLSGVGKLDRGEGRPEAFTDDALDASLGLSRVQMRRGIRTLSVIGENGHPGKRADVLDVTERVAAAVKDIIGPKYTAPGTVEGVLQAIYSRGMLYFVIYDSIYGGRVRCDIPDKLKTQALSAFDESVLVSGMVSRDSEGHPRYIKASNIEKIGTEELPQSIRGLDPDFTGTLTSAEYLKQRWSVENA
jgi:hypothetical protein